MFGNPFYLWTLLGLLVPIAIHLWSKREAKIIKMGSIKFLTPSDSKQSSRIKLNELWLFILRMLIITIIAIIISEPQWQSKSKNSTITYVVDPALLNTGAIDKIITEINYSSEVRLLAENLPIWDKDVAYNQENNTPNYWQLLQEMNFLDSDSIVVLSHAYVQGFKGKRSEISKPIKWIPFDSVNAKKQPLQIIQKSQNLEIISVFTSKNQTAIIKEKVKANNNSIQYNATKDSVTIEANGKTRMLPITREKPVKILFNFSDSLKINQPFLETSFKVLTTYLDRSFDLQEIVKSDTTDFEKFDLVIWFNAGDIPEKVKRLLIFEEDKYANKLIHETAFKNTFQLTSNLNIENSISDNLTEQLVDILALDSELDSQIKSADKRQLDSFTLWRRNFYVSLFHFFKPWTGFINYACSCINYNFYYTSMDKRH